MKSGIRDNRNRGKVAEFLREKAASGTVTAPKADWDPALHQLELMKGVVMNPYSHPSAPNIPRQEIVDAADAVERFLKLAKKK